MQYNANIIIIISNNGVYGTIRMHQERTYPGRISGTDMLNPNFAALAKAYGGFGESITRRFSAKAFERARSSGKQRYRIKRIPLLFHHKHPANTFHKIILLHRV